MKKIQNISILLSIFLSLIFPSMGNAQELGKEGQGVIPTIENDQLTGVPDTFYKAKVLKILESGQINVDDHTQDYQKIQLKILNGDRKREEIIIDHGTSFAITNAQKVKEGETLVIAKPAETPGAKKDFYYVVDKYRVNGLIWASLIFFGLAVFFGRKKGFMSIVGMLISVVMIFYYIIPSILNGSDPLLTCLIGAIIILFLSLYLSHGFNKRTTVALFSALLSLGIAVVIDIGFVYLAKLTGAGTEEAFYLQFDSISLNLQGILLGGIIIGVLGVLDDVTTGLAASIEEVSLANPKLKFAQLYKSGLSVGREHIASLVNTLVLAYVGASFPLLLLYSSSKMLPIWVTLNSNFIGEEIIRSLVGSTALVIAVPLTAFLAAIYFGNKSDQVYENN